jgi:hypothetical protein
MKEERKTKTLTESDPPVYVDPKTLTKGYLIIPLKFVNAIGRDRIPTFIGDTLSSAWPVLWSEVRRIQPNLVLEGFCTPDDAEPTPRTGVDELDKLIDTSRYTIVIKPFQLRLPGEQAITVYGGFCFPETPARILIPIKGKLLSTSEKPIENLLDKTLEQTVKNKIEKPTGNKSNKWWQLWK